MNDRPSIPAGAVNESLVLVVDDQKSGRLMLSAALEEFGLDVITAENGSEAVEKFEESCPGLVLMDIAMPVMDGIEATRIIKGIAGRTFVPIVLISGLDDEGVIRRGIDAGGDDFIAKPFSIDLLNAKIRAIQRIRNVYNKVQDLYNVRQREEEVAEQIFSGAVERGNVALDQIKLIKRPASTFSGDVQLTAARPNGDLNILLGDFTGHGLTSVVGALPLAETFRAMTGKGYEAEEILNQINRKLHSLLPTGMFLAASFVTLSKDGSCIVWNGGMPDIMVLTESGEIAHRFESSDPPLGIISNLTDLKLVHYQIHPDHRILMVSDGVLEARNNLDEYFGEKRLLWAIFQGCKEGNLLNRVINSVESFSRGHEQEDDISLIEVPGRLEVEEAEEDSLPAQLTTQGEESCWQWSIQLQGSNLKRVNPVAIALSQLQEIEGPSDNWHQVFTVLTELYVNALDHGVLQLSSALKSSPEGFAEYFKMREESLNNLSQDDYVQILLTHVKEGSGGRLIISVRDSGYGFDHLYWLNLDPDAEEEPSIKLSGRGIILVRELCDSLEYTENGALARAVYTWE